jgi:hypothetical protein
VIASRDGIVEADGIPTRLWAKNLWNVLNLGLLLLVATTVVVGISVWIGQVPGIPNWIKSVGVILASAFFTTSAFLKITELCLVIEGAEPYVRTFPGQYQNADKGILYIESYPFFGWISNRSHREINSQGFRDVKDFAAVDLRSGRPRVMILGDSFIWGVGVQAYQTIPNMLQKRLDEKYDVYSLAVPGWGIDQMYLAYGHYRDVIVPNIVILAFIDDDIDRVLEAYRIWERVNKPSFSIQHGELLLRTSISNSERFVNKIMSKSIFFSLIMRRIYRITVAKPIAKQIFLNFVRETQNRQEQLAVLRIPTGYPNTTLKPRPWIEATFKETRALYLDPSEEITGIRNWFAAFYLDDGHMSAAGNEFIANYVYRHVFGGS